MEERGRQRGSWRRGGVKGIKGDGRWLGGGGVKILPPRIARHLEERAS